LGRRYQDARFAPRYAQTGEPADDPWRRALISRLPDAAHLGDEPAAGAVRSQMDWKYLLALELADAGFDASVRCEFRGRLLEPGTESLRLDQWRRLCQQRG